MGLLLSKDLLSFYKEFELKLMFCIWAETRQMSSDFGFIGSCWECHLVLGGTSLSSHWSLPHILATDWLVKVPGAPWCRVTQVRRNVSSAHRKLAANIIYRVVMIANNIREPQTRDISQPQIMGTKKQFNERCQNIIRRLWQINSKWKPHQDWEPSIRILRVQFKTRWDRFYQVELRMGLCVCGILKGSYLRSIKLL